MFSEEDEGSLKLGLSTNLLDGYKPNIYLNQIEKSPLKPSNQPGLYESDAHVRNPDCKATWSGLTISLHATTEDLVTALIQVRIRPELFEEHKREGGGTAVWPAGGLALEGGNTEARKQALTQLSEQLGLDLTKEDQSYALVRMVRKLGEALHQYYETGEYRNAERDACLTPEAVQAIRKLQKLNRHEPYVDLEGAKGYVKFCNTFGSHFISSIEVGDSIFQVFSYGMEAFEHLDNIYRQNPEFLKPPYSTSFSQYTTPRNSPYGYTSGFSNICIASQDNKLTETIQEGKWHDSKYSLTNSIFTHGLKPHSIDINEVFRKNSVISVKLTSINVFAEYYRKLIWRRVLKGAMYCLYWRSPNVEPFFSNECPYDLNEIYKDSDIVGGDGLISNIATPTVSFFKENIDLGSIHINFAKLIKVWSEFSNALEIPQSIPENCPITIKLPGSSLVTIVSYIISVPNAGKYTVNLSLSESAFNEVSSNLICGEFYGGLLITNTNATKSLVVMNGLCYEIVEGKVEIVKDIRTPPPSHLLTKFVTDLQFSLISAEARLGYLFSKNSLSPVEKQSLEVMRNLLLWLGGNASSTVDEDGTIVALKARALYLSKLANVNQGPGLPIPYLKYGAYKDTINSVQNVLSTVTTNIRDFQNQIRARKEEERRLESEKGINENIIQSGQLIEGYIRAQEAYQKSMSELYITEFNEKKEKCDQLKDQAIKYQEMLKTQRTEVSVQVDAYKEAVEKWQEEQTIKASLDIASNIFSLGFAFITPSNTITALVSLGSTVQKIQKAVNIFNALIKTYNASSGLPSNPQQVVEALSQDLSNLGMTSLEWDEMKVQMDACLNVGPPVDEKSSLSTAFSILVLRGKALLQVQNQLQILLSDLAALSNRTRVSEEQMKRLEKLHLKLQAKPEELDVQAIDLVGLTGQLYLFQRQMLMTMASTIVIQDRALQYEYLRPPTPIGSFSMINLQLAILTQAQSINIGIQVQPPPELHETPIIYEIHGVKSSKVINNSSYEFSIPLSAREFSAFNYVRVRTLRWEVGGITSTDGGKYYSELNFGGQPFFDRGFNGNPLEFQTSPRMYTALNNVSDSSHFIDESKEQGSELHPLESSEIDHIPYHEDPFKGMISDITPFSTWKIRLPPVKDNEGIHFDKCLTIRLKFYIYAQLLEGTISSFERIQRSINLRSKASPAPFISAVQSNFSIPNLKASKVSTARDMRSFPSFLSAVQSNFSIPNLKASNVSTATVLDMMYGKSVCAGADVVFSLDEEQINNNFELQYNNRKGNPDFFRSTGLVEGPIETNDLGNKSQTIFEFHFNAPRLQFYLNNSNTAQVKFYIESGEYTYKLFMDGKWVDWGQKKISKADNYFVQGDVPLGKFVGNISSQHQVVLYLNKGAFSAQSFISTTNNPLMDQLLTNYFTNLKGSYAFYTLGTLDIKDYDALQSLTPKSFTFRVQVTDGQRKMLQLFITTTGSPQAIPDLYLKEPIPSLFQSSLIINTRILFADILPATLNTAKYNFHIVPAQPSEDTNSDKPWYSKVDQGKINSPFETITQEASYYPMKYSREISLPNDMLVFDLAHMKLVHGVKPNMNMIIDLKSKNVKYTYKFGEKKKSSSSIDWGKMHYSDQSIKISAKMNWDLEFKVIGTGQNQLIQLVCNSTQEPKITTKTDSGACKCDEGEIRKVFFKKFKENIQPKLESLFNQSFSSISLFALKNILFPDDNLIDLKEAYVPGDLVVFGNFTK